jgi:hypothetical protein
MALTILTVFGSIAKLERKVILLRNDQQNSRDLKRGFSFDLHPSVP